jgi:hypothetical protein
MYLSQPREPRNIFWVEMECHDPYGCVAINEVELADWGYVSEWVCPDCGRLNQEEPDE